MPHDPALSVDLLIAANHAHVSTEIGRWLVHDARGPLQGVTLTLALLAEPGGPPLDDSLRGALAHASDELEAVVNLADRLLRFPQPAAEPEPVVAAAVLQDAEQFFARRRAPVSAAWPAPELLATLPALRGVPDHLRHILLSLLLSAARAAGPSGHIAVEVAAGADAVELRILATAGAPGAPAPARSAETELRVAASRTLLELAGGGLDVTVTADTAAFTARIAVWRPGGSPTGDQRGAK